MDDTRCDVCTMDDDPLFRTCLSEFKMKLPSRGKGSGVEAHRSKLSEARMTQAKGRKAVGLKALEPPLGTPPRHPP